MRVTAIRSILEEVRVYSGKHLLSFLHSLQ